MTSVMRPVGGLPAAFTSFVGRQREMTEVRRLLGSARLVTLTGAGGVGKTRLALEVAAASARSFPGGVWLVDLAPVRDPALVADAVAVTLGVVDQGTRPVVDLLAAHVAERRLLLVLDNCEHLVEACARLAQRLLSAAAEVRVLATSRETLRLTGEHVVAVPPLGPEEAAELLVQRAAAVRPGFRLTDANRAAVDRLCAGLDGLPLAIELAASRLRTLSVEPVVERLEDRFALLTAGSRAARPHQQTLRAAVDWSWELCGPAERLLWSRLSVFAGSFTLEAAEAVCAGEGAEAEADGGGRAGEGLAADEGGRTREGLLAGQGALAGGGPAADEGDRTREALAADQGAATREGLAEAEGVSPQDVPRTAQGVSTREGLAAGDRARAGESPTAGDGTPTRQDPTPGNGTPTRQDLAAGEVMDVLDRLVAQSLVEHAGTEERPRYRLLETIRQYGWEHLAGPGEERRLRRRHRAFFLALAERCRAHWCGSRQAESLARLHADHSNLMAALEYQQQETAAKPIADDGEGDGDARSQSQSQSQSHKDRQAALDLPAALVFHWIAGGCLSEGRRYLDRALTAAPEPTAARLRALLVATHVACIQADPAAAHRFVDEADGLAARLGDAAAGADACGHRGTLALHEGRTADAVALFEQAVAAHTALGDRYGEITWRCALGTAQTLGDDPRAPGTCAQALAAAEEHGERWSRARLLMVLGRRAWERGEQAEARERTLAALESLRGFRDGIGVAGTVEQLAWITAQAGESERAGRLLGAARALREDTGITIAAGGGDEEHHVRCTAQVRGALGPAGYEQALTAGAAIDGADLAITYALGKGTSGGTDAGMRTGTGAGTAPPDPAAAASGLTRREEEVVALVARGMTNRRIAAALVLSPRTVDNHVNRILTKLGFSSRAQVAAWWAAR